MSVCDTEKNRPNLLISSKYKQKKHVVSWNKTFPTCNFTINTYLVKIINSGSKILITEWKQSYQDLE